MWEYEKKLQYPVKIARPNPKYAKIIISQYGGPDGEMSASLRYLSQRYSMPYAELKGLLTDIGTEELAHFEMIAAMVHQLTRNLTPEEIVKSGFDTRAMSSATCTRIWQPSRRPVQRTTTCSASLTTRMSAIR